MAANLRKHARRSVELRAYVETPTACSVADVSETGAKLLVKDPTSIPDEFLLRLRPDLRKWCRVVWRCVDQVGIEFITMPGVKN